MRVTYEIPRGGHVRISVFDLAGRRVAVLADGTQATGAHSVSWTDRTLDGPGLPAGVYFVRIESEGWSNEARIVILR